MGSKMMRYYIMDNFLTLWFRFVYKYINYIESGSVGLLKNIVLRDYPTFSGMILECYFRQQAYDSGCYTHIGNYWDKRGENEIDIILVNELEQTITFGEVKRQADNMSLGSLSVKAEHFLSLHAYLREYKSSLKTFSLADL